MPSEESNSILEEIAALVVARVGENWAWAKVDAQIDDATADFVISFMDGEGNLNQMAIERAIEIIPELSDVFGRLQDSTADEEKGPWFRCQYTVHSHGGFETEFSWEPPDWAG